MNNPCFRESCVSYLNRLCLQVGFKLCLAERLENKFSQKSLVKSLEPLWSLAHRNPSRPLSILGAPVLFTSGLQTVPGKLENFSKKT